MGGDILAEVLNRNCRKTELFRRAQAARGRPKELKGAPQDAASVDRRSSGDARSTNLSRSRDRRLGASQRAA